jgi:hypothetical protein
MVGFLSLDILFFQLAPATGDATPVTRLIISLESSFFRPVKTKPGKIYAKPY